MPESIEELIEKVNNDGVFRFKIKVVANSKINTIEFCEEYIKIKIMARAVEGKANKAIVEFLSKILNVSKSKISIVNGEKSSIKLMEILK